MKKNYNSVAKDNNIQYSKRWKIGILSALQKSW